MMVLGWLMWKLFLQKNITHLQFSKMATMSTVTGDQPASPPSQFWRLEWYYHFPLVCPQAGHVWQRPSRICSSTHVSVSIPSCLRAQTLDKQLGVGIHQATHQKAIGRHRICQNISKGAWSNFDEGSPEQFCDCLWAKCGIKPCLNRADPSLPYSAKMWCSRKIVMEADRFG